MELTIRDRRSTLKTRSFEQASSEGGKGLHWYQRDRFDTSEPLCGQHGVANGILRKPGRRQKLH
jgi:hypothetical protein